MSKCIFIAHTQPGNADLTSSVLKISYFTQTKKMGQFWKLIIGKLLKNETGNLEFLLRKAKKKYWRMENKPSMNETDKKVA